MDTTRVLKEEGSYVPPKTKRDTIHTHTHTHTNTKYHKIFRQRMGYYYAGDYS